MNERILVSFSHFFSLSLLSQYVRTQHECNQWKLYQWFLCLLSWNRWSHLVCVNNERTSMRVRAHSFFHALMSLCPSLSFFLYLSFSLSISSCHPVDTCGGRAVCSASGACVSSSRLESGSKWATPAQSGSVSGCVTAPNGWFAFRFRYCFLRIYK